MAQATIVAMAEQFKNVKGLTDLQKFLDQLPVKMEQNVMRGALAAGCKPMKQAAISYCPVGPASESGAKKYGLYAGALRDSIRISTRVKGHTVTASVKAGGKRNGVDVWYAKIVEFTGAVAHVIAARTGLALSFGIGAYKAVDHPGMRPKPFMRPAFDGQWSSAIVATGEYIKRRLSTKHGIDTASIDVEVEDEQ